MKDQPARVTLISIPSKETVKVKNLFNVSDVCGGAGRVCDLGLLVHSSDVYFPVVHAINSSAGRLAIFFVPCVLALSGALGSQLV
jgi:hypothetical protein